MDTTNNETMATTSINVLEFTCQVSNDDRVQYILYRLKHAGQQVINS